MIVPIVDLLLMLFRVCWYCWISCLPSCMIRSILPTIRAVLTHWRSILLRSDWWAIKERYYIVVCHYIITCWWQDKIGSATQLNLVIFKDKATAPVGKKFFSLFPGLGYAAGYKVYVFYIYMLNMQLTVLGPPTNLQVRRPTFRARLPSQEPWFSIHKHIWREDRKGNDELVRRKVSNCCSWIGWFMLT